MSTLSSTSFASSRMVRSNDTLQGGFEIGFDKGAVNKVTIKLQFSCARAFFDLRFQNCETCTCVTRKIQRIREELGTPTLFVVSNDLRLSK